jgi:hypothetical protein
MSAFEHNINPFDESMEITNFLKVENNEYDDEEKLELKVESVD